MVRLRSLVALMLLAFWLPASWHVQARHCGPHHQPLPDHHHADSHTPDGEPFCLDELGFAHHVATDGACMLSCGKASPATSFRSAGIRGWLNPEGKLPAGERRVDPPARLHAELPCDGPGGLARTWRFLLRTALPVRAPSVSL